jgi:hypothetical protein
MKTLWDQFLAFLAETVKTILFPLLNEGVVTYTTAQGQIMQAHSGVLQEGLKAHQQRISSTLSMMANHLNAVALQIENLSAKKELLKVYNFMSTPLNWESIKHLPITVLEYAENPLKDSVVKFLPSIVVVQYAIGEGVTAEITVSLTYEQRTDSGSTITLLPEANLKKITVPIVTTEETVMTLVGDLVAPPVATVLPALQQSNE